ncbi:MAG: response regulator [Opitutaceae bacterium]|nr:response regulator [Opitutaceae bacterium]
MTLWGSWGLCHAANGERGFPLIDSFSAADVGADAIGLRAVQDPDGILYFGSNSLLTYDGDRWRSYSVGGSYGMYGLDLGPEGKLWAGAVGEIGWFSHEDAGWQYHSLRRELSAEVGELGPVWHAFTFRNGAVFATTDKLLQWDGKRMRIWPMPGARRVRVFRVGDDLFVQHEPTGLYVMREDRPELVASATIIGATAIFWIARDGEDLRLLNTNGLFRFTDRGELIPTAGVANDYIRTHHPTAVVSLPNDRLAVGTMDDGLAIINLDGTLDSQINTTTGLKSTYIIPLVCDRDGVLWTGSRGAIFRMPVNSQTTVFDHRANFPLQPPVKLGRYEDRLVLANHQGVYGLDPISRTFSFAGVPAGGLNDFVSYPAGLLTAGYRGVTRLVNGHATVVHATDFDVHAIAASRLHPDQVLIADGRKILELSSTGNARVVAQGLPDAANSIAEDADGNVWFGTKAHGLFVAKSLASGATAKRVTNDLGLPNLRGDTRVAATADHTLVVFNSTGAWLRDAANGRFVQLDGAPARPVTAVAPDADGSRLWVIHRPENGAAAIIGRVSVDPAGARWEPHAIEGLRAVGVPRSIFAESNGDTTTLWIGGSEGVLRHDLTGPPTVPTPRAPLVRATARTKTADSQQVAASSALPASTQSIELEFSVPEFGRRSALRLESWIEGFDATWIAVGAGSRREVNVIGPGEYRVRARVVAESGVASAETVFPFSVLKPWWRTTPALCGMGIAIILLGSGAYQLRIRTLRRRNAELEQKVRERTEQLERASAAKTEFVANMSHDIRNPLNGIVGLALALEDTRLDNRQQEIVATLRECTTYLSTLVDDVLDFASIEAGRVELRPGAFNAGEMLRSIVATLRTDAIQSGATLTMEIDPNLPAHLMGDAGRIQQILVNYVSNALKYAGGQVRIAATAPANSPGEVEFSVLDQGPGLSAEDQATLFTKFSRTPQARQLNIPGAGLGLASCRLLADIMGGSVGVVSRPGEGARFFVRLPMVVATEPAAEPTTELPNSTVLLVEDTDYNAWAITAVLARLGLRSERARDGAEALRMFGEKRFNIVLLDRNLPDMDGLEVARRMRQMEGDGLQSILLAITAYCTEEDRAACMNAGMDAFVGKPLTPEKLRKVLLAAGRRMLASASVDMPEDVATEARPEVDTTLLSYLGDDTEQGLGAQIDRFVANLQLTDQELAEAAARSDCAAVAVIAHRLLGQAKMVGASDLSDAACALEEAARAGDFSNCLGPVANVQRESGRLTEALRRRRSGQTA